MIVAQLAEQSLPTPELHGLNPVIGKFLCRTFVYRQLWFWQDVNKEKEGGNGPIIKQIRLVATGLDHLKYLTNTI